MDAAEFKELIRERDEEVNKGYDAYDKRTHPSVVALAEGEDIRLFSGGLVKVVDTEYYNADWDGSEKGKTHDDPWGYSDYAQGRVITVEYVPAIGLFSKPEYFKIRVYMDSWDNGTDDNWKPVSITKAIREETVVWKEVE